ncbi:penicillin-binding protein 2 [Sulfurimonas sp. HSL-1716]|uniref:peptidoglycan D,D-transpeptidase FtsI family protein n=1 Tax=Hydrocurvibacter sulfurireducens TaxID=3131937 RepID=UPI0031F92F3F
MQNISNRTKSNKIFLLFSIIVLGFVVFLSVMLFTAINPRDIPSLYTSDTSNAKRGNIISADGFHIATTQKLYKAIVNTNYIDPKKMDLFIQLFSIYSNIDPKEIQKLLYKKKGVVVLSYNINSKQAQYLKNLAFELRRYKVFVEIENPKTHIRSMQGLNIIESGEARIYPYGNLLTPVIGYPHKIEDDGYTKIRGVKGVEKRYEDELSSKQDAKQFAPRDVNNYMILNKDSYTKPGIDGLDVKLNIPVTLQIKVERILDKMKKELDAKHIMAVIMSSKDGRILSLASSNRYLPQNILKSDYPSLNTWAIEYAFEPGSVIKPLTFTLLLEKKLVNPYDLVNGHNGKFKIGRKVITDEHKFDWLSAENVIVYSSNIGMAQLAQKLSGLDFYEGLSRFGLSHKTNIDLSYEKEGSIPTSSQLDDEIYKATASYGYGMKVTLIQLINAYDAFNNNGREVIPTLVSSLIDKDGKVTKIPMDTSHQVIDPATAERMKKILIKTVQEGTGKKAITPGIEVGGKTGTAHIVEEGEYVYKYNTSFLGFANDASHKYTIGVVVVQPTNNHFAAQTAVPVFKKIVDLLIDENYLKPNIVK